MTIYDDVSLFRGKKDISYVHVHVPNIRANVIDLSAQDPLENVTWKILGLFNYNSIKV